jgi:hypothetical protein
MASLALGSIWRPRTLTDRRNDITTVKPQPNAAGLTPSEVATETPGAIQLYVESGEESRGARFVVPNLPGPRWLNPTILRVGKLLSLPYNWDRQGAPPIDSSAIQTAMDALNLFMSIDSAAPQWTPTQKSGVQLDWHQNGIDLEIAFEPGDSAGYVVFNDRNQPGLEWDGPLGEHVNLLARLFRERLVS